MTSLSADIISTFGYGVGVKPESSPASLRISSLIGEVGCLSPIYCDDLALVGIRNELVKLWACCIQYWVDYYVGKKVRSDNVAWLLSMTNLEVSTANFPINTDRSNVEYSNSNSRRESNWQNTVVRTAKQISQSRWRRLGRESNCDEIENRL